MKSILDAIGNTPLLNIEGIHVKAEYLNPSGSIKDRIAKYIVERAERKGTLKKGDTIVEATSGNTGTAFALVAAVKGYKMVAVMPRGLSRERTQMMRLFGAKIVYVKEQCFDCAIKKAKALGKRKNVFLPDQFNNPLNVEDHVKYLGKEITSQVKKIDAFVAGVGTGGSLIGVGKALRKKNPNAQLIALEPKECAVLPSMGIGQVYGKKKGYACKAHGIEGIGDGIIPGIIRRNKKMVNGVVTVSTTEAVTEAKRLARIYGCFVGPSSGANFLAAKRLRKKYKNVLTLFPDEGEKYLSESYMKKG